MFVRYQLDSNPSSPRLTIKPIQMLHDEVTLDSFSFMIISFSFNPKKAKPISNQCYIFGEFVFLQQGFCYITLRHSVHSVNGKVLLFCVLCEVQLSASPSSTKHTASFQSSGCRNRSSERQPPKGAEGRGCWLSLGCSYGGVE